MERLAGPPGRGAVVAMLAAAALAGLLAAGAGGLRGIEGLLDFRDDGQGVEVLGLVTMSLFAIGAALTAGAFAGGARQMLAAADTVVKVALLVAVAFMFAFPDLSQFENKSLTLRAIFYPILAFLPLVAWRLWSPRSQFPTLLDLCVSFAKTFDVVSNDLHWYGRWGHWDDFVHFVNSVPLIVLVTAAVLVVERRGAIRLGFWGAVLVGLSLYTSVHALWEMYEFSMDRFFGTELQPGGMEEATRNNVAGLAGSAAGVALLWWWRAVGTLEASVVAPAAALCERRS